MSASMTRKHFEALAAALRNSHIEGDPSYIDQWIVDCQAVAEICARFNPNFDRARFLAACGVQEN